MSASDPKALFVPHISWDDLLDFHTRHFPTSQATATQHSAWTAGDAAGAAEEEEDGLGYYLDGVKRTLTDEQIAMFRHSEIQTLLREKRRREEAVRDALGDEVNISESPVDKRRESQQKPKQYNNGRKRRKTENKPYTHRRHARELDEVKHDNIELDY